MGFWSSPAFWILLIGIILIIIGIVLRVLKKSPTAYWTLIAIGIFLIIMAILVFFITETYNVVDKAGQDGLQYITGKLPDKQQVVNYYKTEDAKIMREEGGLLGNQPEERAGQEEQAREGGEAGEAGGNNQLVNALLLQQAFNRRGEGGENREGREGREGERAEELEELNEERREEGEPHESNAHSQLNSAVNDGEAGGGGALAEAEGGAEDLLEVI